MLFMYKSQTVAHSVCGKRKKQKEIINTQLYLEQIFILCEPTSKRLRVTVPLKQPLDLEVREPDGNPKSDTDVRYQADRD